MIECVDVVPVDEAQPGEPRSDADAAFLRRYNRYARLPIIISAVLPLIVIPESDGWAGIVVGVLTWLVFLVDAIVHFRCLNHYGRTALGRFDLFVVIATAPWFLISGIEAGEFIVVLRLARVVRLVVATQGTRRLMERLGRVAMLAAGVLVAGSLVAYHAEHHTNPEFATFGDALWWGIVTLTTVGYGDIVPKTTTGRWAGVMIMLTGIAVLGTLAGSLASFFRLDEAKPKAGIGPKDETTSDDPTLRDLVSEVSALRVQLEALAERLRSDGTSQGPGG
jgi:voltage-gated potassium channel